MDAYTSFASVYDTFMDNIPYEEWSAYLIDILKEYNIEDSQIIGVVTEITRNGKIFSVDSKKYKLYVLWVRISYPVRFVWRHLIRPQLGKLKRFLLEKLKSN